MNPNTYRTLEFEAVRALLLGHAGSAQGRARVQALVPLTEIQSVRAELRATGEGLRLLQVTGREPYHDLPDLAEFLPVARVDGAFLEPRALSQVASFAEGAGEIAHRVSRAEGAPSLSAKASEVPDLGHVATAIRRAILPTGEVSDDASPRLGELRRTLTRLRTQLHGLMESYLRRGDSERILQDRLVTTRNDRYVLLVKAEHRGALPGIVHGGSGSGASLFVEPLPAVELNNDIVEVTDEERREVVRILKELTARVGLDADAFARAADVLGELDAIQARALLARDMDAVEPEITGEQALDLIRARHPLLMGVLTARLGMPRRTSREVVPVTLRAGFGSPVLVISGPNTGGKTVALKTVGLLALMAQCGLYVPAATGSVLPVFRRIYADIGDDQSIAADLSTFSAHLAQIVEMTRDLALPALVLLDEVGAGTDPTEGGALGVAIVDHFRSRGAMVVATTHHGVMKSYALATDSVTCASFGYDTSTFAPTYRLSLGTPGRSLALEMAERLGLPAEVVRDARTRVDRRDLDTEAVLKQLEQEREALAAERGELARLRLAAGEVQARAEALEHDLRTRRRAEVEGFARELKKRGEEAQRRAQEAIRKAVSRLEATRRESSPAAAGRRASAEVATAVRAAQQEVLSAPDVSPALDPDDERPGLAVAVGQRARVRSLGIVGQVLALDEAEAELAVSGKRLRVSRADLVAVSGPAGGGGIEIVRASGRSRPQRDTDSEPGVGPELNLIGLTVDEALPLVDKMLDEAALCGRREVRIVHGFGTGALRRAVSGLLQGHPHVTSFREGGRGEGGAGATVVEVAE